MRRNSAKKRLVFRKSCGALGTKCVKSNNMKNSSSNGNGAPRVRIRNILVPVDCSECSLAGLRYAIEFAKKIGARLIVLQVVDLGPQLMTEGCGVYPLVALQGGSRACFETADARVSASRQFRIGSFEDCGDCGILPGRNLSRGGGAEDRPHHYVDAWPHRSEACTHRQRCGTRAATCAVCGARGSIASARACSERDETPRVQGSEAKPAREQLPEAVATRRGRKPIAQACYIAAYNAQLILAGISSRFRSFWNLASRPQ